MTPTFPPEGSKGHGGPSGAAMAEALGQKSLLGFGVLLAWLVLFHLLVNIWLLCVFTSLLVVYGGWLTSQAVLESNNLVHLERFITLEPVKVPLPGAFPVVHVRLGRFCPPDSLRRGRRGPAGRGDPQHRREDHQGLRGVLVLDRVLRERLRNGGPGGDDLHGHGDEEAGQAGGPEGIWTHTCGINRRELTPHVAVSSCPRWGQELAHRVLNLFGCHLRDFTRAKELWGEQRGPEGRGGLWGAYSRSATPHLAVREASLEVGYARAVVDLLLQVLVPAPHLESRTGRFVVGELITCNVLLPFIARLSDPDWLNGLIIQVCGGPDPPEDPAAGPAPAVAPTEAPPPLQEATCLNPPHNNPGPPETEVSSPESAGCDVTDAQEAPQNPTQEEPPGSRLRGTKSGLFHEPEPDSPLADCNPIQTVSLVRLVQEGALCQEDDHPDLDDGGFSPTQASRLRVGSGAESLPLAGSGDGLPRTREASSPLATPSRELHLGVEQGSPGHLGEPSEGSPLHSSASVPSFSFDPLSSPEGPVIIQNLRITGTITAKEHRGTGSHPYTLYTIKVSVSSAPPLITKGGVLRRSLTVRFQYETAMGCCPLGPDGVDAALAACEHPSAVAYHTVNRRYSEFLNLQTRLEEKADLRKLLKGKSR